MSTIYRSVTANYTVDFAKDKVLLVDCTAGAVKITLPNALGTGGFNVNIVKIDTTENAVQVYSADNIEGNASIYLSHIGNSIHVISDNSTYHLMGVGN